MEAISALIAGFGLAAPAGLNAWLCLFIVGILAKFTDLIVLPPPTDALTNTWVLVVLGVLTTIEFFADKIAAVDTINDIIGTVIRPLAGGVLFTAGALAHGSLDPTLTFILGMVSAGGVHAVKATARPMITASTGGLGNPVVSTAEDLVALTVTVLALVLAPLAACLMGAFLLGAGYGIWRLREWRKKRRAANTANVGTGVKSP
jgi:hypothetical protein